MNIVNKVKRSILIYPVLFSVLAVNARILQKEIPDKLVVLTFDDATASHYSVVAPMLKAFGFGATFFICEFPPNFSDSSKYMTWHQIKKLDEMGFEVANHTKNHPALTQLTKEQITGQVNYIGQKCDSMNIPPPETFAYPGYDVGLQVVKILKEMDFRFARVGGNRPYDPLKDHPLLVPSWGMGADNKKQVTNALKAARNGKVVVLTIHGVPDIEHPFVSTPPELFREHLQYLSENNYKVIALRDLSEYIDVKEAMKRIRPEIN